ncbi:glycoside hydrolase family 130 protein [Aliiglaciecola sp.]|nr:glycoside hydrolase family 130 protein [Aliiglaciecola sp.]
MKTVSEVNSALKIRRRKWRLQPDPKQVICRPHIPGGDPQHIENIIQRILAISGTESQQLLKWVKSRFSVRHRHLTRTLKQHYKLVECYITDSDILSEQQKLLIGAYFTMEYAVASAALFNPSIVPHPDQSKTPPNTLRFIMSLRATGEGHVSSIVFRTGIIGIRNKIEFDQSSHYVETAVRKLNPDYDKHLFIRKLNELNATNDITEQLFNQLPEHFNFDQLQVQIDKMFHQPSFDVDQMHEAITPINWLANSNYKLKFDCKHSVSERVIFPTSEVERGGIEDARFVQFYDENGAVTYYATYTAYNGLSILPQLIETTDFDNFKIVTLNGKAARNKGMALFPRKINGHYAMLSRQDGESNYIMFSDHLHFWHDAQLLQMPNEPWEFVQIGNCGSPIETNEGWIVLTHGVGPMRQYSMGAILLDLENPARVKARLIQPLLSPLETEREGYVPNVVYSCGGLINNNELLIPYAMSDMRSGMVSVNVNELIKAMTPI